MSNTGHRHPINRVPVLDGYGVMSKRRAFYVLPGTLPAFYFESPFGGAWLFEDPTGEVIFPEPPLDYTGPASPATGRRFRVEYPTIEPLVTIEGEPQMNAYAGWDDYVGEDYAGQDYVGEDYAGQDYVGEDYVGEDYAGQDYVGEDYVGEDYVGEDYYVGADSSYRDVAARAVMSIARQRQSPIYGYLRTGIDQKIYLFPVLDDARAWYDQRALLEPGYDYAAVFTATDLRAPIAGLEDFGSHGDAAIGHWWPFALGVPAGALGGYYYRKWQESHPGQIIPGIPPSAPNVGAMPWLDIVGQDANVGAMPWLDIVGQDANVGAMPWLDIVGQDANVGAWPWLAIGAEADVARRRAWPQTRALIQSAIREVSDYYGTYPAEAYVWSLEAPGTPSRPGVELFGTTEVVPFSSRALALDYVREKAQSRPIALAMFDKTSPHWPNPVTWRRSDDPEHEGVIAQHVATHAPTRASGEIGEEIGESVGEMPWYTIIGQALAVLRRQAEIAAEEMPGSAVAAVRDALGRWKLKSFRMLDDADDWFGLATVEPKDFTYAAYFSKGASGIPSLENEKIGGARKPSVPGPPIPREIATATVTL